MVWNQLTHISAVKDTFADRLVAPDNDHLCMEEPPSQGSPDRQICAGGTITYGALAYYPMAQTHFYYGAVPYPVERKSATLEPHSDSVVGSSDRQDAWIQAAIPLIEQVASLPGNWDTEGSRPPDPTAVKAAEELLDRLRDSDLGALPAPFVCPIAGGGIQLEWESSGKYLEIEFLDGGMALYLKEKQGESMESGEFPATDAGLARQLLEWFTAF